MKKVFSILAALSVSSLAQAEIIRIKVDVAYDKCETTESGRQCSTTPPNPQNAIELNYNGWTAAHWETRVTQNGYVLVTSIDAARTSNTGRYYFNVSQATYLQGHDNVPQMKEIGTVFVEAPRLVNEIYFHGEEVSMGNIMLRPTVGIAAAD